MFLVIPRLSYGWLRKVEYEWYLVSKWLGLPPSFKDITHNLLFMFPFFIVLQPSLTSRFSVCGFTVILNSFLFRLRTLPILSPFLSPKVLVRIFSSVLIKMLKYYSIHQNIFLQGVMWLVQSFHLHLSYFLPLYLLSSDVLKTTSNVTRFLCYTSTVMEKSNLDSHMGQTCTPFFSLCIQFHEVSLIVPRN